MIALKPPNGVCKAYQAKFILEARSCTKCSLNSVFSNVFLAKLRKTHCTVVASKNKMQVNDCGMRNLSSPALVNTVEPRLSAHFSLVQFFHEYQETQSHKKPNTPCKRLLKQCKLSCVLLKIRKCDETKKYQQPPSEFYLNEGLKVGYKTFNILRTCFTRPKDEPSPSQSSCVSFFLHKRLAFQLITNMSTKRKQVIL